MLYLSKRAHPCIQLSLYFLCTRVRGTGTCDCNNPARVMKYIQGTIGLPLIISTNESGNIKWYVDAVFAVHKYMRIHTGGFVTMGT